VIDGVAGHLVPLIERVHFLRRHVTGLADLAGVEVKAAADTVAVEDLDQPPVMLAAVVIAHHQCLGTATRKTQ
jgi:hypothetical protein